MGLRRLDFAHGAFLCDAAHPNLSWFRLFHPREKIETRCCLQSKAFLRFLLRQTSPNICPWQPAFDAIVAGWVNTLWTIERTRSDPDQIVAIVLEKERSAAVGAKSARRNGRGPELGGLFLGPFQLISSGLNENCKRTAGRAFAHVAMAVSAVGRVTFELVSPRTTKTASGPKFVHKCDPLRIAPRLPTRRARQCFGHRRNSQRPAEFNHSSTRKGHRCVTIMSNTSDMPSTVR